MISRISYPQRLSFRLNNSCYLFLNNKIKAKLHFLTAKFQNVAILAPYSKNDNFGPFRPKIAEKTPCVPKKGS